MKYRFQVSERNQNNPLSLPNRHARRFRLKGLDTLRRAREEEAERIRLSSLFEIGELPEGEPTPKRQKKPRGRRPGRKKSKRLQKTLVILSKYLSKIFERIRTKLDRPRVSTLPIFAGALCAALVLSVIASGSVLLHLFGGYHAPYQSFTVPSFVGKNPALVLQNETEKYGDELPWNLIVQYADHEEIEEGRVISQSPAAGVTRRIYRGADFCNITLTVSRGRPSYELPDLAGQSERDASLLLGNHGISVSIRELEDDTVPKGNVLQTIPKAGTMLREGDQVILQISKGTAHPTLSVPSLLGLTEAQANTLLRTKGFSVGSVSYQNSPRPAGIVVAQTPSASSEAHEGTAISYTVSLGPSTALRTVPNLCGLSYADAVARLREYGLVVGSLTSVQNAAPRGTVIEQTPPAGTPITSTTVSVDLYLSS